MYIPTFPPHFPRLIQVDDMIGLVLGQAFWILDSDSDADLPCMYLLGRMRRHVNVSLDTLVVHDHCCSQPEPVLRGGQMTCFGKNHLASEFQFFYFIFEDKHDAPNLLHLPTP